MAGGCCGGEWGQPPAFDVCCSRALTASIMAAHIITGSDGTHSLTPPPRTPPPLPGTREPVEAMEIRVAVRASDVRTEADRVTAAFKGWVDAGVGGWVQGGGGE